MIAVLAAIFQKEGISGFYRGFGATMLNTFSMRMFRSGSSVRLYADRSMLEYAYFFFYSFVRSTYIKRITKKLPPGSKIPPLSTAAELLLGALAGALAQIFTIPVSVIATRQQIGRIPKVQRVEEKASTTTTSEEAGSDDSFLAVAREIIEEEGVTGLWLGIKPGLVLTVNPAITYGFYERVKGLLLRARSSTKLSPGMSFLVGAFSKTLATVVSLLHRPSCLLSWLVDQCEKK